MGNLLTYWRKFIPLPVYNFVYFTSIWFFYAFDYTGLDLGVTLSYGLTLINIPGLHLHLLDVFSYRRQRDGEVLRSTCR